MQIAEKLQTTKSRVAYWSQMTMNSLHKDCLDHVEVDIPALRRLLNLERLPEGRYTKLSELLRDMPSDEELERLDKARGNLGGETKRRHVTQKDLYILRQRLDGRSYDSLCAELGWSRAPGAPEYAGDPHETDSGPAGRTGRSPIIQAV